MRTLIMLAGLGLFACSSSDTTGGTQKPNAPPPEPAPAASPVTAAPYPDGPYGFKEGMVVPATLTFTGLVNGQPVTYKSTDYFDSDGSKGINAVIFDTSAQWCGFCQQEAATLESKISSSWGKDGVVIITLMIEDNNHNPSTTTTADQWIKAYSLVNVPVVLDHSQTFFPPGQTTVGLPNNTLVDPRTMKIVKNPMTGAADDPAIAALVATNKLQQ